MAELKTRATNSNVEAFIDAVAHPVRKADAFVLLDLYKQITGLKPVMWGPSIVGFGEYSYITKVGKEETFLRHGFSPRKQNLSLYLKAGMELAPDLLPALGKHKTSKACLYINKLADIQIDVLTVLIAKDVEAMEKKYG